MKKGLCKSEQKGKERASERACDQGFKWEMIRNTGMDVGHHYYY